jgi:hypothetical protein
MPSHSRMRRQHCAVLARPALDAFGSNGPVKAEKPDILPRIVRSPVEIGSPQTSLSDAGQLRQSPASRKSSSAPSRNARATTSDAARSRHAHPGRRRAADPVVVPAARRRRQPIRSKRICQTEFAKQKSAELGSASRVGNGQRALTRLTKGEEGGRNHLNEGPTSLVCLGNPPR